MATTLHTLSLAARITAGTGLLYLACLLISIS